MHFPSGLLNPRELVWAIPFVCIGLSVLALLRPPPEIPASVLPASGKSRTVADAAGTPVTIALPYKGTVLTWGALLRKYLHDTRAPDTLAGTGTTREHFASGVDGWLYPRLLQRNGIWESTPHSPRTRGANAEIEGLMAMEGGAYLGIPSGAAVPLLRRVGMPALYLFPPGRADEDERFFAQARVETAVIGQPERGEELIADYRRAFADLERELQPGTLTRRTRVLILGASARDWRVLYLRNVRQAHQTWVQRAGLENAAGELSRADAERILALEPDIIFLVERSHDPETTGEFLNDPRWRGLKAVRERRVYRMPGTSSADLAVMFFRPLWTRWMAEVAYPERMAPKMRRLLRDGFAREYGYRLSEKEIDRLLRVDENGDSPGYGRFVRNAAENRSGGND